MLFYRMPSQYRPISLFLAIIQKHERRKRALEVQQPQEGTSFGKRYRPHRHRATDHTQEKEASTLSFLLDLARALHALLSVSEVCILP